MQLATSAKTHTQLILVVYIAIVCELRGDQGWIFPGMQLDSADVNGPLLLREVDEEDEGPPPYEVVTVTPRKISTQSRTVSA